MNVCQLFIKKILQLQTFITRNADVVLQFGFVVVRKITF